MVECPTCGKECANEFGVKQHHVMTHDESLAAVTVDCAYCGSSIETVQSKLKQRENMFCDRDCHAKWNSENRSGENHPQYNREKRECKQCGAEFTETPSRIANGKGKFCSRECYGEWLSENNRGESHHQSKGETVECDWCRGEIYRSPSRIGNRNFCDMECQGAWRRENTPTGEDHPNHTGGSAQYSSAFNERKRRKVRERDGKECVDCGMSQEEHQDKYGRKLHVHHIQKARDFDDESGADMDNLVTLCHACHLGKWEKMAPLRPY